jgi:hypothetical protein
MKKLVCFLIVFILFSYSQLIAQLYTASDYWKMENDPAYTSLLFRQQAGETLRSEELDTLARYKTRLSEYFEKLSDNEKSLYYKNRSKWSAQPGSVNNTAVQQDEDVYAGERSKYTQYVASSGLFGFLYGASAAYIIGAENSGAIAIPLLTSGASTIIPMLSIKDRYVSYNSLALSIHGKGIGGLQGAAFGFLLTGDNVEEGKLILGIATLSSIGLGRLGFVLGRDKPWSQGRVALYAHYGFLMPLEGLAIDAAFNAEDPRIYAATSLAFGAGGYFIADRVARWHDFTRGDVTATSTLSWMNGLLGLLIIADEADDKEISSASILIPAAGALAGTVAGHLWLKNARLTSQQGRNVALGSFGGALIGFGLTAIFTPETATPYYIMGYATGMTTYALLVQKYKKDNIMAVNEPDKNSRWNINLMPQNLLLNRKIASYANANPGKRTTFLPAFSASVNF